VVEHDTETIERADLVIDMGPGGGRNGGAVTSIGTPAQLRLDPSSLTGRWLSAPPAQPAADRPPPESFIELTGVTRHNLRGVDVAIPRGRLTTVTGVSGSGKSTLIRHVLQQELQQRGERVIEVDQRPIGRTPRSTPATYVKIMDRIRTLFASLPAAQIRGYRPGRFSFNVKGGRCETCAGQGALNIEMAFLPNVYVPCDVCEGRRYNPETLAMTWRGKNIAEVLASTVDEIIPLFEAHRAINGALQLMSDLGLGYLTLGQSSATLSGGEAQRIKLVAELSRRSRERTVYLLDEPSTGLHMSDLARLITVLQRLVERGDTVVVIEHNLDLIRSADWIVDLGPGGGTHGGRIVFQGPVDELVATTDSKSVTGQWLRR
jgi:excinuclease ABC subunit A